MTNSTVPAIQQRADRLAQKGLGTILAQLLSEAITEPPPADLLLLLARADRKSLLAS